GKTTFLRLVLGLHRATAGFAKVFGRVMTPNSADLRRRVGYIPTNPQFPRGMTPITYLDYIARLFGIPGDLRKPKLATLIRADDLPRLAARPEGPHPQEPLRTGPRRRAEGDHAVGCSIAWPEGLHAGTAAAPSAGGEARGGDAQRHPSGSTVPGACGPQDYAD